MREADLQTQLDSAKAAIGHLREALADMVKKHPCHDPACDSCHCESCNAQHALSATCGYDNEAKSTKD